MLTVDRWPVLPAALFLVGTHKLSAHSQEVVGNPLLPSLPAVPPTACAQL